MVGGHAAPPVLLAFVTAPSWLQSYRVASRYIAIVRLVKRQAPRVRPGVNHRSGPHVIGRLKKPTRHPETPDPTRLGAVDGRSSRHTTHTANETGVVGLLSHGMTDRVHVGPPGGGTRGRDPWSGCARRTRMGPARGTSGTRVAARGIIGHPTRWGRVLSRRSATGVQPGTDRGPSTAPQEFPHGQTSRPDRASCHSFALWRAPAGRVRLAGHRRQVRAGGPAAHRPARDHHRPARPGHARRQHHGARSRNAPYR